MRALAIVSLLGLSGCGYALMQTARPVPAGELDVTLGASFVFNEMVSDRGPALDNFPPHLALRYGLTDNIDLGATLLMGAGALIDGKLNLMPPGVPYALSVQLGIGGAAVIDSNDNYGAAVIHLPVRLLASWQLSWFTPYAGVGYGFFWVFGYGDPQSEVRYADRTGHGDGLLMLNVGVELFAEGSTQLLFEYGLWTQVVDDPGDFYSFADNHMFSAGVRF